MSPSVLFLLFYVNSNMLYGVYSTAWHVYSFFSGLFASMIPVTVIDWKVISEMTDNVFVYGDVKPYADYHQCHSCM